MKLNGEVTKIIHVAGMTPKEPEEVLVQQQLKDWLEPGWCMTAPVGSESKLYRKQKYRLWKIAVILALLWLLAPAVNRPMGRLIHALLAVFVAVALIWFIRGRRPWLIPTGKEHESTRGGEDADLADANNLSKFEGEGGAQAPEPATPYPERH